MIVSKADLWTFLRERTNLCQIFEEFQHFWHVSSSLVHYEDNNNIENIEIF